MEYSSFIYQNVTQFNIFSQTMKLSGATKSTSTGEIVNLMSLDALRIHDAITYAYTLCGTPLVVTLSICFIYNTIGLSSLAGIAVILIMMPLNGYFLADRLRQLQVS